MPGAGCPSLTALPGWCSACSHHVREPNCAGCSAPTARLLVVTPTADHLGELVEPLGLLTVDPRKEERLAAKLDPYFELGSSREYRAGVSLDHQAVAALAGMGPGAWHTDAATLAARVEHLAEHTRVTVAATIACYTPIARNRNR